MFSVFQEHDGPLTQYFPREGRELRLPLAGPLGWPSNADQQQHREQHGLAVLTTKAGDSLFVHGERGCLWLWSLTGSLAAGCSHPDEPRLSVAVLGDHGDAAADQRLLVFPLSTSSDDVIASGRCVRVAELVPRSLSVRLAADHIVSRPPAVGLGVS